MKNTTKALLLIGMGLFLFSRILSGKLFFYINERFYWLIVFAVVGFVLVGLSYRYRPQHNHEHHHHDHEHDDDHQHGQVTWFGVSLLLLPILLGLLIPPRPLGAAAMANRDVSIDSLTSAAAPEGGNILAKPRRDKNVLDWLIEFRSAQDPASLAGEEVEVIGFVYRDDRFGPEQFMVSRFVLSCCAADASPLGLVVQWPDGGSFADDEWVTVKGHLEPAQFAGEEMPIIIANTVTVTEIPDQPYLYPF
jgi:uncharacterized repeat protein (TIGR03943 family)